MRISNGGIWRISQVAYEIALVYRRNGWNINTKCRKGQDASDGVRDDLGHVAG